MGKGHRRAVAFKPAQGDTDTYTAANTVILLLVNSAAILSEDRFLNRSEYGGGGRVT